MSCRASLYLRSFLCFRPRRVDDVSLLVADGEGERRLPLAAIKVLLQPDVSPPLLLVVTRRAAAHYPLEGDGRRIRILRKRLLGCSGRK